MSSHQNYCLTKLLNRAQLFGDSKRQFNERDLIEEDKFVGQKFKRVEINLPTNARSSSSQSFCTFSADGKYVATTNSEKIYISNLQIAKVINVLDGHTRCIRSLSFHPVYSHILASGCEGGQVKIWDLKMNASQECHSITDYSNNQVITSLSFHPNIDILAIAVNNLIFFHNWRTTVEEKYISATYGCVKRNVRLVRFDLRGRLIIGITNDQFSDGRYLRVNNLLSNINSSNLSLFNLNNTSSTASDNSTSNLNNFNQMQSSHNLFDRQSRSSSYHRVFDEYTIQQNEISITRNEAFFNLTSAITNSIADDSLLPDNLPAFSFLQQNYQSIDNVPTNLYNRMTRFYRRLENEMNSEQNSNNDESSYESSNGRQNSLPINETNDEELNVIIESTNLVERFLNRHRTAQDENSNSNSSYSEPVNINLLSTHNRDYYLRRRLSSNRMTFSNLIDQIQTERNNAASRNERSIGDRLNCDTSNPISIRFQTNTRDNSRMASSSTVREAITRSIDSSPGEARINLYDIFRESRHNSTTLSRNSRASTINQQSSQQSVINDNQNRSRDNHNQFYALLSHHQTSRRSSTTSNLLFNNSSDRRDQSVLGLINRIRTSINAINRASPLSGNNEIEQLSTNSHTTLNRLMYYINYKEKLNNLRNRIRQMLHQSPSNLVQSIRYDLAQYYYLVVMLSDFTDQMQQILTTDLRFTQLSRLYLMRTASINNATQSSRNNDIFDISINDSSNDSNSSSQTSSSNLSSISMMEASMISQPIPSTSTGITKRKYDHLLNDKIQSDAQTSDSSPSHKKLKIPLVKITGLNESDNRNLDFTNNFVEESTSLSRDNRELLRIEVNSLLFSLEILTEMLSTSRTHLGGLATTLNHLNFPVHRVHNPIINQLANYNEFNQIDSVSCRIQCFDFDIDHLPNLKVESSSSLVVAKCKLSNESSIDISKNSELLCCLVPSDEGCSSGPFNLCVYSLKKSSRGECLFIFCSFNSNAISVSFSPSSKFIVVGLNSSRLCNYYTNSTNDEQIYIAQIFVLNENLANAIKNKEFNDYNKITRKILKINRNTMLFNYYHSKQFKH